MAEYICINPSCVIAQSQATFPEALQCPVCRQMLASVRPSLPPLDKEGLVHFTDDSEITALAQEIIAHYPPIIGEMVALLFESGMNYQILCSRLKLLYFHTVRFAALTALSYFLRDPDTSISKPLLRKLVELHLPFDSTWKDVLVLIAEAYPGKSFFIDGFAEAIDELNRPEAGYGQTIKDSLRQFSEQRASVLQAGIWLRNALHHDNSILDEEDFARISPYYADIVFTLLRKLSFLRGDRYWYVAHRVGNTFHRMHGPVPEEVHIDNADAQQAYATDQLFFYDSERSALMPLTPFFLKLMECWDDEGEAAFERMDRRRIIYETRRSKKEHVQGFELLRQMLNEKGSALKTDLRRIAFPVVAANALEATRDSLHAGYLQQKYLC